MDFDVFLTSPRWDILKLIAENELSPIEIAEELGTTVSYVSQQLKLLDAAGLVIKKKTGFVEKGKPRSLFTISRDIPYLAFLSNGYGKKGIFSLNNRQKALLKIWMNYPKDYHESLELIFSKLEKNLGEIEGIFVEMVEVPKVFVVSTSKSLKEKIDIFLKSLKKKISCSFVGLDFFLDLEKGNLVSLYDPLDHLYKLKKEEENEKDI